MHPILATGIVSLGKELVNRACQSISGTSPQTTFKTTLDTQATAQNNIGALKLHKSSLEKQILQHPQLARYSAHAQASEPFSVKANTDNTYTLSQKDTILTLSADNTPLGSLLRNYFKTCQHLQEKENLQANKKAIEDTFSFYPA